MGLNETFTAIANAIREKTGKSDKFLPQEMPSAIAEIKSGGGGVIAIDLLVTPEYINTPNVTEIIKKVIDGGDGDIIIKG